MSLSDFFKNAGYNINKKEGEEIGGFADDVIAKTFNIFKPQNSAEAYSLASAALKAAGKGALPYSNAVSILNIADPYIKNAIEEKFNVFEMVDGTKTIPSLTTGSRGNLSPTEIKAQYAKENIYQGTPPNPIYSDVTALTNLGLSDESIRDEITFRGGDPFGVDFALAQALANELGDYEVDDTKPTPMPGAAAPTPYSSISAKSAGPLTISSNPFVDPSVVAAASRPLTVSEMMNKLDTLTSIQDDIDTAEAGMVPVGTLDTAYFDDELEPTSGLTIPMPTVPMTIDLSSVFNPATANDKDGGNNDLGHNAPSGGYKGYSGEDVEASYAPSSSPTSGQSSGNWNTTARQTSTTTNDSGSSSGGK